MPPPVAAPPPGVLLVRHGQSEWNAVRRWQGSADIALTALGRAQAAALGRAVSDGHPGVAGARFTAVWSSDLQRASGTAAVIAHHLGVAFVATDARLREAHAGSWQGLTPEEIEERWPGYLAGHRRPDDFERAESVVARALDACGTLLASAEVADGGHVIAVTHSGVMRALCRHVGAVDERVPNLGGLWVHPGPDGIRLGGRVAPPPLDDAIDAIDTALVATLGLDGPGEDPGDETDDRDRERAAERGTPG